jgi:drug/metabolite transporter (DMT)-like permease
LSDGWRGSAVTGDGSVSRPPGHRGQWLPKFVAASAIWGCSFLFIKVGLEDLTPVQVAFARTGLGALAMAVAGWAAGERLPRDLVLWRQLFVLGLFWNVIPFLLFSWAETRITSVLAGLFNATTPLFTVAVVCGALRLEPLTRRRVAGLAVGFAGVLVVLGPWRGTGEIELVASLACVAATAAYGVGYGYTRLRLSDRRDSALSLTAGQLWCATAVLGLMTLWSPRPTTISLQVMGSMLALGVLGTGVAYVLNVSLIRAAGPTIASMTTYVIPVFSTVAGLVVLGEPLSWNEPVGAVIVLAGVALAQGQPRLTPSRRPPRPPR